MDFFLKSLKIREELGDKRRISYSLNNIGEVYFAQEYYAIALDYFQKSLDYKEEIDDKFGISYTLNNVGALYAAQERYQQANQNCQRAFEISSSINNVLVQKRACECLYEVNKEMGQSGRALNFLERLMVLEDSIQSKEIVKELQQMEFAKELLADSIARAEKARLIEIKHQMEIHEKNTNRNIAIGVGVFFLILAGVFFSTWRFTQRSKGIIEKEKERSENLLLNILPAQVAEELKEKGHADARNYDLVTILFTDFKDFTKAAAQLSAQELVEEINICFKAFDQITEKFNIEKIKTIGDSYMAAGGLPMPEKNSVKNTILAALEMQGFIKQRKLQQKKAGTPVFQMRVGVHTGPVVAGIVGVKKFQYDVWGDTVNTASRLESHGVIDRVNISQRTFEIIQKEPEFVFENRGQIEVKGKEPIQMWFVEKV